VRSISVLFIALTCLSFVGVPRARAADGPARIALFQTAAEDASLKPLAAALDPVLGAELEKTRAVQVTERPSLDLPAMQLALDCVGQTAECLRSVTDQSHVEGLLAATLHKAGSETVLTVFYFDARGVGEAKTATRQHSGDGIEQDTLNDVPGIMKELFAEPAKNESAEGTATGAPGDATAPDQPQASAGVPMGPIVLGAGGLVLVGVGAAFGFAAKSTEDSYASTTFDGKKSRAQLEKEAAALDDKLSTAKKQALFSNLGFGLGAAAVAGAVIWWVLTPDERANSEHARLSPWLGPKTAGLSLHGRFGSL
jgi:hypothetical protein